MKRVWKCDFCYDTNIDKEIIRIHENDRCSFNPKFKKCYTCKNFVEVYDTHDCKKDLDYWEMSDDGNCPGWEAKDKKLLRKIKLGQINNIK